MNKSLPAENKKMKHAIFAIIIVAAIAGCTQQTTTPQSAEPGVREFRVTIGHAFYDPNTFEANSGDLVRFIAVAAPGTASHNHGITIDEFSISEAVTSETQPKTIEFHVSKGTFTIYCRTCWEGPYGRGHPDIKGTLIVK